MKKPKQKEKKKTGRPEKYTITFCLNEIKSIYSDLMSEGSKHITWQDLIRHKEYSHERISEWRKKFVDNSEFSHTIKKIEKELENRLFKLGLSNKASTAMAIFGLKNNYNWTDKQEITGKDGTPLINLDPFKMIRENSGITKK